MSVKRYSQLMVTMFNMKSRECTAIQTKGEWNAIAVLPVEYRPKRYKAKRCKELGERMEIRDGKDWYDFLIDPKTWLIWIKKV